MSCPICGKDNEISYFDGTCTNCGNKEVERLLKDKKKKEKKIKVFGITIGTIEE